MTEKQQEKMLEMKTKLGIIETEEYEADDDDIFTDKNDVECDDNYDVINPEMADSEVNEYLKIQNAYNILQIKNGVNFFVTIAVIGIILGIILGIISLFV